MINITITGVPRVQTMLAKLAGINRLVAEWMKSGQPDQRMKRSFEMNFARSGRPDKWAELDETTEYERDLQGYPEGPPMIRSGSLMDEITSMRGKVITSLRFSQMSWGIDQLSSDGRKKFGPNQTGKKARHVKNLPARPMIGFQKEDGKVLVKDLRDWIIKSIK